MTYLAPSDPCLTRLKFKSTAGPPVTVTSCVCGWKLLNGKKKPQKLKTKPKPICTIFPHQAMVDWEEKILKDY